MSLYGDTVTGRSYTATRPRGLASWNPQPKTVELLGQVNEVLREYQAHLPLTARQIFYRLVGRYGYSKTEKAYKNLLEALNRARRAGIIPWDALRDDGTTATHAAGWSSPASFWSAVRSTAESYRHNLADEQPTMVELWVEAAGMVPQIARVARDYGLSTYSAGGFNSVTEKHEAALRFRARYRQDKQGTLVLHIGDYDPSGAAIVDSAADDILTFVDDYGVPEGVVEFQRVAVTPAQIESYQLITAPQKPTDRRGGYMADTVQAEALAPDQMAAEVRSAIEESLDLDLVERMRRRGEQERTSILATLYDVEHGLDEEE